jgi:hypothetical protein
MKLNNAINVDMKKTETQQTAMQALEIYLSAAHRPETLRVKKSGKVEIVSRFTILFSRLASAINRAKNASETKINWASKAREAIFQKMIKEVRLVNAKVSHDECRTLNEVLQRITSPNHGNPDTNWRDRLSGEISVLRKDKNTRVLASALQNIVILDRPENAQLYAYVRKQLIAEEKLSDAIKNGLTKFLTKEYGLPQDSAKNAATTMHHLMLQYESSVTEAWFITSCAGQMVLKNELNGQKLLPLPLAYLQIHHGLTLEESVSIYRTVKSENQTIADAREKISVMQVYNVAFDEADAIVSFAESLESTTPKELSKAQRIEIAWLRLHSNKDPEQAKLISLQAGRIPGQIPPNREAQLTAANSEINQEIANTISEALPAGWPDEWEFMPDGSRRLKNTAEFTMKFMDFFQGSLDDCTIDEKQGLSKGFINDVGRSNFKFGSGDTSVTVSTDSIKAIAAFESFAPDHMVRQTLSKALYQAGGNSLEFAMSLGLAGPGKKFFSILPADPENEKTKASSNYRISLQHTEDGKVRVGYTLYMKHFSLMNTDTDDLLPINSRFNSSAPATDKDHTARAIAVIEFDYAQLSKGILEPKWVRPPELRLTIEPDHETIMTKMFENKLNMTA